VVEAETGEKALEFLEQFAFDVVITDLRLPGVDGSKVIESAWSGIPASSPS
jgi:YesN/AraC family two-component response regulator